MDEIVVGVDHSPGAQRALEWALGEAAVHQCTVRLVHAIPPNQSLYPYGMGEMVWLDDINEQAEKAARELLDAALAQAGGAPAGVAVERVTQFAPAASLLDHALEAAADALTGLEVRRVLHDGQAARALLEAAATADLLVGGTHGAGGLRGPAARLDSRALRASRGLHGRARPRTGGHGSGAAKKARYSADELKRLFLKLA